MDAFVVQWMNLLLRWAHIVVGVAWIGTSFYFMALDYSLRRVPHGASAAGGESWLVHGGGFYHVQKYLVAPSQMPKQLKWYKWDAYLTWVTGFFLLIVQYYLKPELYLIDHQKLDLSSGLAIGLALMGVAAGWGGYELICRTRHKANPFITGTLVFGLLMAASWAYSEVFSGRGAMIHVGVLIGSIMAANVFAVIIPNQKKVVASLIANEAPDDRLGRSSKQRSVHNNYLTLPLLLIMVSNHYPLLYTSEPLWLVIAFLLISGGSVRHLINRHDIGDDLSKMYWIPPVAILGFFAAVAITSPKPSLSSSEAARVVSNSEALLLVETHCLSCHAMNPESAAFDEPPLGVRLETLRDILRHSDAIAAQTVQSEAMPLGNLTEMTAAERIALGQWLEAQDE